MTGLNITFLAHSGFAVETDTKVLVFDYFKDPTGTGMKTTSIPALPTSPPIRPIIFSTTA